MVRPGAFDCPSVWVRVEGMLCGPGSYGHLGQYEYQLDGTIMLGPCENECGEEPTECAEPGSDCMLEVECDLDDQDCEEGQPCVPTSLDGSAPWGGSTCTDDMPGGAAGDPCTREENEDDCGPGLWCVPDAFGSDTGECVAFCSSGSCIGDCILCTTLFTTFETCTPGGPCSC